LQPDFKDCISLGLKAFSVNIIGLSQKAHLFAFKLDEFFFKNYDCKLFERGVLEAEVVLDKHETFLNCEFKIKGSVELTCDRSLDVFDFPIQLDEKIIFKYGDQEEELSEEIVVITRDRVTLDLGHYLYEFILLAIPIRKIHPRFESDIDGNEGKLVYTTLSSDEEMDSDEPIDPRWEQLKKVTIKK
jgi:uncharacterized metal-binding protein YceD (DUF177 family)